MDSDDWATLRVAELKRDGETAQVVILWRRAPTGERVIDRLGVKRVSGVVEWPP